MMQEKGRNMLGFIEELEDLDMIKYGYFDRLPAAFFPLTHRSLEQEDITLEDLTDKIDISLSYMDRENIAKLYLNVPRLLRAITNYAIESNKPSEYALLKEQSEDVCYSVFEFDFFKAKNILKIIRNHYYFNQNKENTVMEISDNITWNICDAYKMHALESILKEHYPNADTIAISGHGGYRPGFMLATQLGIKSYAVRNSGYKHKDNAIKIIDYDIAIERLTGRNVIAFDEDVNSGNGLNKLIEMIKGFQPKSIMCATLKFIDSVSGEAAVHTPAIFSITDKYFSEFREHHLLNIVPLFLREFAIRPSLKNYDNLKKKKRHCEINGYDYGDY